MIDIRELYSLLENRTLANIKEPVTGNSLYRLISSKNTEEEWFVSLNENMCIVNTYYKTLGFPYLIHKPDSDGVFGTREYRYWFFDENGEWKEFGEYSTYSGCIIYLSIDTPKEEIDEILKAYNGNVILPIAKKIFAKTIAFDLVSVQPMPMPKLFYTDFIYNK